VDSTGTVGAYGWHSVDKWGPFLLWTHVGAKLGAPYSYPEIIPCRASLTCTWRAFKTA
jgi:hypothetical protein